VPADDEAVACGDNGLAVFERLGYRRQDARVFLYPFEARACRRGPRREPLETQGDADQLVPEELALAAALAAALIVGYSPGCVVNCLAPGLAPGAAMPEVAPRFYRLLTIQWHLSNAEPL
jgi:hypothetical protein